METKTENYKGSDCTGNDGSVNRTLTIGNSSKTNNNNFQVFVNNSFLHLNVDYTVEHKSSGTVITFLNRIWNDQAISVIYETTVSVIGSLVSENYTGGDCSGLDGDSNRTLAISNTQLTYEDNFQVFVNNSFLHLNRDYTVSHKSSSSVITFLNSIFNSQSINVRYATKYTGLTETKKLLPLDTQFINNEINEVGDTITIRKVTQLDYDTRGNAQKVLGDSKIAYTSGDDALEDFYGANWIAQTFTTGSSSINTTSIKIKVKRVGTPSTITIGIQAVDGNSEPDGTDLTSGSLDYIDLIDDGETKWIVIPLEDYTLSANTTYALVIRESSGDSSNKYQARIKTIGTYSSGNILTSSDSGSTWTAGNSDILFDLYGDTETVAVSNVLTFDDDSVKAGVARHGDIRLFFQNSEDIDRGDRVKFRNLWYKVKEITKDSAGDVNYFIDAVCSKI